MVHLICNYTIRFCIFVDARLAEIRNSSCISDCKYCRTALNPADVDTIPISPKNRKKFLPWTKGPKFLLLPENKWPLIPFEKDQVVDVASFHYL